LNASGSSHFPDDCKLDASPLTDRSTEDSSEGDVVSVASPEDHESPVLGQRFCFARSRNLEHSSASLHENLERSLVDAYSAGFEAGQEHKALETANAALSASLTEGIRERSSTRSSKDSLNESMLSNGSFRAPVPPRRKKPEVVSEKTTRIHLWRMGRATDTSLDASRDDFAPPWMRESGALFRAKWALSNAYTELENASFDRSPWGSRRMSLYASLETVGTELSRLSRENARLVALTQGGM
jgi:hypothetical protein